jgi:hypothetical protein
VLRAAHSEGTSGDKVANIGVLPAFIKDFGLVFVGLMVLNLPELAHCEEMRFRRGASVRAPPRLLAAVAT